MHFASISFSSPMPLPMLARPVRAGFPSPADDFVEDEIDPAWGSKPLKIGLPPTR